MPKKGTADYQAFEEEFALNNMGAITREEVEAFADYVLKELCPDWKMEWTKCDGGICLKKYKEILIPERMIGQYPWVAKEYVLHETTHIFTNDNQHGEEFYKVYVLLLRRFMVEGIEDNNNGREETQTMTNIFRQAKQLLDKKDAGGELTEEELHLINTAILPLMGKIDGICPQATTIGEGLEELANTVEESQIERASKTTQ